MRFGMPANKAQKAKIDKEMGYLYLALKAEVKLKLEGCWKEGQVEGIPIITEKGELCISFNAPLKYRWWQGGQSIEETLKELGASEKTLKKYVPDRSGGILKPKGAE